MRLRVYDEPLTVACAHLASGEQSGDEARRAADFDAITRSGRFSTGPAPPAAEEGEADFRCGSGEVCLQGTCVLSPKRRRRGAA